MRRAIYILLVSLAALAAACSDSGSKTDGGSGDGDVLSSCPAQPPGLGGAACTGSFRCGYGEFSCCGIPTPLEMCVCGAGSFNCALSECNAVCPDAGADR